MARPNPLRPCLTHWKVIAMAFLLLFLANFFYRLGVYQASKSLPQPHLPSSSATHTNCHHLFNSTSFGTGTGTGAGELDFQPHHLVSIPHLPPPFEVCAENFTDYCPCQDPKRERRFRYHRFFHRERHCPEEHEKVRCLVPRPKGYRTPFRWPASRDYAWFANVPSKRLIQDKKNQNWVRLEVDRLQGDRLVFPGGGTSFPDGAKKYVDNMARIVPLKGGQVRTVLDTGCGVASFGARLLDYDILTMSIAPRDVHEAQVQFALERGLPAMLGVLSTYRLPFPARSFDMAHCSRCLIQWTGYDGLYLSEIDRVLRPGGYWVLSGPPINWRNNHKGWERKAEDLRKEQGELEDMVRRLCWKKIAEKSAIAVWQKPMNHLSCFRKKLKVKEPPPFCQTSDHDAGWYRKLEACITPLPKVTSIKEISDGTLEKWPKRMSEIPPRILSGSLKGGVDMFLKDKSLWNQRVSHYEQFLPLLTSGRYRNVMDMNAGLGGFAAAMSKYPVWVMNVVPTAVENNTLGVIYERGFIGTYMDWCEAFSTYPRTYDLIHANGILEMYMNRCDMLDILLEMYRILRPEGAVIIRDQVDVIFKAREIADRMQWHSQFTHNEHGPFNTEKVLFIDTSVKANAK